MVHVTHRWVFFIAEDGETQLTRLLNGWVFWGPQLSVK